MAKKQDTTLRSAEEVRADLERRGLSITEWARRNGVQARTVYDVLYGHSRGKRGEAHRVAVLLGMKNGVLDDQRIAA